MENGDNAEARQSYEAALTIHQQLAAREPNDAERQWDVAASRRKIGDVLMAEGDSRGALEAYRDAVTDQSRLLDASNVKCRRELTSAYRRIGDLHMVRGESSEALDAYCSAVPPLSNDRFAVEYGGWERDCRIDLSLIATVGTGEALHVQGDVARGRAVSRSERDEARDWSACYEKIGDILVSGMFTQMVVMGLQGLNSGKLAFLSYSEAAIIRKRWAERGASNSEWLRDLLRTYEKLNDFQDALSIVELFLAQAPNDVTWWRELVGCYYGLARVSGVAGEVEEARDYCRKCREALLKMRAANLSLDPPLLQLLHALSDDGYKEDAYDLEPPDPRTPWLGDDLESPDPRTPWLGDLIREKAISLTNLSGETGIPESTISDYIEGKRDPSVRHIGILCRYLHIDPADLISKDARKRLKFRQEIRQGFRSVPVIVGVLEADHTNVSYQVNYQFRTWVFRGGGKWVTYRAERVR
jgi:tetratricopeptide (TPR) repeat protein